jgi:flavin reductase (DIM6/NTAB) family NADH-FMN oxidoreductase RutF/rubredoxin
MNIEAFFKVTYGLYLITTGSKQKQGGYIANTAFQVTAEPPRFAISCHKDNYSSEIIKESENFAISILERDTPPNLIGDFGYNSSRDFDKFKAKNYFRGKSGVPIVADSSLAWFECKLVDSVDVGTHILFIGDIVDYDLLNPEGIPLTYDYYHKVKKAFSPKNSPTYIEESKRLADKETRKPETGKHETWTCQVCHYIYESANGDSISEVPAETKFEDLPEGWVCPICGAAKEMFVKNM